MRPNESGTTRVSMSRTIASLNDLRIFVTRSSADSITFDTIRKRSKPCFIPFFKMNVELFMRTYIVVRGNIPSGSTATVELSTYSSEVPGVKLCYEKRIQMVALDSDFIGVEFPVTAFPDTAQGKVLLGVTVQGATGHVMIKRTPSDKGQMSQLTIAVP